MLIDKVIHLPHRLDGTTTDIDNMKNLLDSFTKLEYVRTEIIGYWDDTPMQIIYYKIKNSPYYLFFRKQKSGGYTLIYHFCVSTKDSISDVIYTITRGSEVITGLSDFDFYINVKVILTDNLFFIKTDTTNLNSTINDIFKLCKFNDNNFYQVDPFLLNQSNFSFDKTFYAKPTTINQNILIPARLKNTQNKIINLYPLSCYYTSGLVDNTFYKFLDGEYGYYANNILYK